MPTSTLNQIRAVSPLIHCITNYVTVNDVANVLLAIGARPIMADDPEEVEEITALFAPPSHSARVPITRCAASASKSVIAMVGRVLPTGVSSVMSQR